MTNLRWLKWAIARHFRQKGLRVHLASIKLGNVAIDGEVEGKSWKMALEIKTPRDDITRGIGQLAEALAYGYNQVALVTTVRNARRIRKEFGYPRADSETLLREANFVVEYVIPEFSISGKRADLLIVARDYNNYRPYLLVECKRRATTRVGPSYATAVRQAMRYAKALPIAHFAVFDGWVMLLAKTSYPYLLGIYDARIPESLTPTLLRKILQGVRQLEKDNASEVLNSLQMSSGPRDPDFISSQVLKHIAKVVLREPKGTQPDKGQIEILVKQWRGSFRLP